MGTVKEIAAKLAKVSAAIGAVGKGKSGQVNYAFQQWETVLPKVQAACVAEGLWIVPSVVSAESEPVKFRNGGDGLQWKVELDVTAIDVKSGESVQVKWFGEAADTGDKGLQKAVTNGFKYLLLKLLMIPTKEEESDAQAVETVKVANKPEAKPKNVPTAEKLKEAKEFLNISSNECMELVKQEAAASKITEAKASIIVAERLIAEMEEKKVAAGN